MLRHWLRTTFARLDGHRERRVVALGSLALLLALLFGPWMLRAVDAVANPVTLTIQDVGASPLPGPIVLRVIGAGAVFTDVQLLITSDDGNTLAAPAAKATPLDDPSTWIKTDFRGEAGRSYRITAKGATTDASQQVVQANTISFTVAPVANATDATGSATGTGGTTTTSGGTSSNTSTSNGASTSVMRFAEIVSAGLVNATGNSVAASGVQSDFPAASAVFSVLSGGDFSQDFPASRGTDGLWRATFLLPPGKNYDFRLVVLAADGLTVRSPSREVDVPPAATPATPLPPTIPPALSILFPQPDASVSSPANLAARVSNATAVGMVFEILDQSGVSRNLQASDPDGDGVWNALFEGVQGSYVMSVRASLGNGFVQVFPDRRGFRLIAAATGTAPVETPATAPAPAAATNTEPAAAEQPQPTTGRSDLEPLTLGIEVVGPTESVLKSGPVPLTARVTNGLPEKVVAVVTGGPAGGETIVVAAKSSTSDLWTATFVGPDGDYRFRIRASLAGKDTFSDERRFSLKSTTAPAAVPPAESVSPPPPAPLQPRAEAKLPATPPPPPAAPSASSTPPTPNSAIAAPRAEPQSPASPPPVPAMPDSFSEECKSAGISRDRCAEWLKAKYASKTCLDAGAVTREDCAALLKKDNLPADERGMLGMATRQDVEQARVEAAAHVNETITPDQMPPAIERLLAFTPKPDERWHMMASAPTSDATATAPALLTLDSDGDGLPDDVEKRIGTDPLDPDTDHDGFSDGEEVKNGYNPLGTGLMEKPLRGIDKAMVDGAAIEEPRGDAAKTDANFTIGAAASESGTSTSPIRLAGKAAPNSVVSLFIYSYLPIVVTTTTDADGNWKYDFSSRLADGRHQAYVSVNDDTGKLVAASSPLSFFVKDAQAVSETDFLRPDVNVQTPADSGMRWFLLGGGFLILVALLLVVMIVRQTRKEPDVPGSAGTGTAL